MEQFINSKLYGRYYPVIESEEYLKEHYMFFKEMVRHEVSFLEKFCSEYEYEQRKRHLKRTTTLLGYPKYGNMLENERTIKNIERELKPSIQQMQNLDNFVYELRYKRRKKELVKLTVFVAIIVICMLAHYYLI